MKVKLEDIIEAMEFAGMETEYYYDTQSEKVLMLFDGMVDGEDNPELFEDIKEGFVEDYIPLPGQYDINEYRIMEAFDFETVKISATSSTVKNVFSSIFPAPPFIVDFVRCILVPVLTGNPARRCAIPCTFLYLYSGARFISKVLAVCSVSYTHLVFT